MVQIFCQFNYRENFLGGGSKQVWQCLSNLSAYLVLQGGWLNLKP